MEENLVGLVGENDGDERLYADWVADARSAGLRPEVIQRLKRKGFVHTRLDEAGNVYIVRGLRPVPEEEVEA